MKVDQDFCEGSKFLSGISFLNVLMGDYALQMSGTSYGLSTKIYIDCVVFSLLLIFLNLFYFLSFGKILYTKLKRWNGLTRNHFAMAWFLCAGLGLYGWLLIITHHLLETKIFLFGWFLGAKMIFLLHCAHGITRLKFGRIGLILVLILH